MDIRKEITITVFERSDGDHEYSIYDASPQDVYEKDLDPVDGGVCSCDLDQTILSATAHARALVFRAQHRTQGKEVQECKRGGSKTITR